MGPIETFKLDMADDFDISFGEASKIMSLLISLAIEQAPGRIARQRMINAFARAIETDREEVVANFEKVMNNRAECEKVLKEAAADRAVRRANNDMRKMNKLFADLLNLGGA